MAGKNRLIHTPEGVRDSYNAECRKKLAVQDKILDTLYLYGYEHIQTPSFEYFDIFSKDRGSVSDREMFKFFDRDNNTLVLRPDMTPAVAGVLPNISWMTTCRCASATWSAHLKTTAVTREGLKKGPRWGQSLSGMILRTGMPR